jgi:nucleotide-binding universal stress UspA family protein
VVDAVIAWEFRATYGYPLPFIASVDYEDIAAKVLADTIAEGSAATGSAKARSKVVEGTAAQVLLTESAGADLLVVGNRGHGGSSRPFSARSASTACITTPARSW